WALDIAANAIYAGGDFTTVRGTTRHRLASIDQNGVPTAWDPDVNGTAFTITHFGGSMYAGGAFTTVNGNKPRLGAAAFDQGVGTATSWNPRLTVSSGNGGVVYALAPTLTTMYVGGIFHNVGDCATTCTFAPALAAVSLADGSVLSTWKPAANDGVWALATVP